MLPGGEPLHLPIILESRGEPPTRKLHLLRGGHGASDGCVACTNLIFSATCTRRMQDLLENEVARETIPGRGHRQRRTLGRSGRAATRWIGSENLFEYDMPCYSFWDDVKRGWLHTDKVNEARKVEMDWLHHH